MEKISGILPASSRITSVDLKSSGASRPGSPSFGRPAGVSSLAKPAPPAPDAFFSSQQAHSSLMTTRSKNQENADIAQRMADGFFIRRAQQAEADHVELMSERVSAPTLADFEITMEDITALEAEAEPALNALNREPAEDLDAPEIGARLDVVA